MTFRYFPIGRFRGKPDKPVGGITVRLTGDMADNKDRQSIFEDDIFSGQRIVFTADADNKTVIPVRGASKNADIQGAITGEIGTTLYTLVADAIPFYMWERNGRAIGLASVGLREIAGFVPARMVQNFADKLGIAAGDVVAYCGPSLRECCYEIGKPLARRIYKEAQVDREQKTFLNTNMLMLSQLIPAGLPVNNLVSNGACTCCGEGFRMIDDATQRDLLPAGESYFYSVRRDGSGKRMLAWISLK